MRTLALIAVGLLAGCQTPGKSALAVVGPFPSAGIVATDPTMVAGVTVSATLPEGAEELGPVEGRACKNSIFDKLPKRETAVEQMRQKAAEMGATGIHSVSFGTDPNPVAFNCWETIPATAIAYRMQDQSAK